MRAIFSVTVAGQDISASLNPILLDLTVSDKAGTSSDTASLTLDDKDGQIIMPKSGDDISISLGWEHSGVSKVFVGKVDEVSASGGRNGRYLAIRAKGMDTRSKAKEPQRKHFDDKTIKEAFDEAGKHAGISVAIDPEFASIKRPYLALDDESFVAFGERIARQLGGTFKIVGDNAILAKRNGGTNPSGQTLSTVVAKWGDNLHTYDLTPVLGRPVEKSTKTRHFDKDEEGWSMKLAETGTEGGKTTKVARFTEADADSASQQSSSDAKESDRKSGDGSVTIEGNISAQPEGVCEVVGCRKGVDGTYRIDSVDHTYSRAGFITTLKLRQPKGAAGKDDR